jgi:hypothetical protein
MGNYHGIADVKSYRYHEYWLGANIRQMNALSISFEPTFSIQNNPLQYVETTDMKDDPRYLFAELYQKTVRSVTVHRITFIRSMRI